MSSERARCSPVGRPPQHRPRRSGCLMTSDSISNAHKKRASRPAAEPNPYGLRVVPPTSILGTPLKSYLRNIGDCFFQPPSLPKRQGNAKTVPAASPFHMTSLGSTYPGEFGPFFFRYFRKWGTLESTKDDCFVVNVESRPHSECCFRNPDSALMCQMRSECCRRCLLIILYK